MEFLMTYGWAILIALVVVGVLAYFGVLNPTALVPEKCTFPVSLTCTDYSVAASSITMILRNGAGRDMSVTSVSASSEALGTAIDLGNACNTAAGAVTIRNGESTTLVLDAPNVANWCDFRDTGREKNIYNFTVTYNWLDSPSITHQLQGELLAKSP